MVKKASKKTATKTAPPRKRAAPVKRAQHDIELDSGIKIRCRHTELADIDTLVPFPRNPNTHSDEQIRMLAKIIKHSGWRNPIVVSLRSGYITKGHGRLEAAKLLRREIGEEQVPVEYQSYETEADEFADIIADNKIAELSTLDPMLSYELVKELQNFNPDFDLALVGFSAGAFEGFTGGEWGSGDPTRHGETSEAAKSVIKVICEREVAASVRVKIVKALAKIDGVVIE